MITAAKIIVMHDDGIVHEYDCDPDDVLIFPDGAQAFTDRPPDLRPRFTPGAEVRYKQSPSQVYTIADGEVFTVPGSDAEMIRLARSSGRVFNAAVSQVYPNVTRKS